MKRPLHFTTAPNYAKARGAELDQIVANDLFLAEEWENLSRQIQFPRSQPQRMREALFAERRVRPSD